MIKEKNEVIAKNEKSGITYRVVGDIVSSNGHHQPQQQLLSSRKTPSLQNRDPNNNGTSTITIIQQSQTPNSKMNYLPSIYTSHTNENQSELRLNENIVGRKWDNFKIKKILKNVFINKLIF